MYTQTMHYELWDTESGNLLDDFETQADAIGSVRSLMSLNGTEVMAAVALVRVNDHGRAVTIASGPALEELATGTAPSQEAQPT